MSHHVAWRWHVGIELSGVVLGAIWVWDFHVVYLRLHRLVLIYQLVRQLRVVLKLIVHVFVHGVDLLPFPPEENSEHYQSPEEYQHESQHILRDHLRV